MKEVLIKRYGFIWRVLSILLTTALLLFAYKYISSLISQVNVKEIDVNLSLLTASAISFIASYYFMALNWKVSGRLLNQTVDDRQVLAFFASLPYKYLPSSIFTFSSRAYFGSKLGLTLKQSSLAQLFENTSLLLANFCLLLIVTALDFNLTLGSIVVGVIISGAVMYFLKRNEPFNFKLKDKKIQVEPMELLKMFVLSFVGWLISGISFVMLNMALGLQINILNMLAANTIAFSLSMLAFFAPGGIGVRELVYATYGLSSVAIIYWRITVFVVDFIVGVPAIILIKIKSRN